MFLTISHQFTPTQSSKPHISNIITPWTSFPPPFQEDINNVDEEILEIAHERELELQEELEAALARVEALNTARNSAKLTIENLEKAIAVFRQQMATLKVLAVVVVVLTLVQNNIAE